MREWVSVRKQRDVLTRSATIELPWELHFKKWVGDRFEISV